MQPADSKGTGGALDGVRAIDLTATISGPLATRRLEGRHYILGDCSVADMAARSWG